MKPFDFELYLNRLNETIQLSGITQTELAKRIGVSKQTIHDYKLGRAFPNLEHFYLLCLCLDVSPAYLLNLPASLV